MHYVGTCVAILRFLLFSCFQQAHWGTWCILTKHICMSLLNAKLLLTKKGFNKWLWNGWWICMRRQVVLKCIDLYFNKPINGLEFFYVDFPFTPLASHSWFRFTACVYFVGKRPWLRVTVIHADAFKGLVSM